MKRLLLIMALFVSVIFTAGCGDDEWSIQNPQLAACQVVLNLFASFDAANPAPIKADPSAVKFVSGNCPFWIAGSEDPETFLSLAPLALAFDDFIFPTVTIAPTGPGMFSASFSGNFAPASHPLCNLSAESSAGEFTITSPTTVDLDADIAFELSGSDGNVNNCVGIL